MKLSNKFSLTIFTTGLTALILLSFLFYKFNYESVLTSQSNITKSIANEISDNINHILSEKIKTTLTLANSNTIIQALEESIASYADLSDEKREVSIKRLNEKWKSTKDPADNFILEFTDNKTAQFLKKQQTLFKDEYGEIFLTNKFGALVASTTKLSTFAHGHKYWWLGSYANGEGAVFFDDRGYDDSVGGYVLGLVVPIKKGAQIIGILKCNLNILGSINKVISCAKDNLIGEFKLTRSGGMVVFEEGSEPLSTQIPDKIFRQLKNNDQGIVTINDSKEKYLVGFSQIKLTKNEKGYGFGGTFESIDHKKGNKGESWYILCYRQMSAIQAPFIKSLKSIVFAGFVIIVVLLLVAYLFGRKIAKPLMILQEATKSIEKGTCEGSIDISQDDELGDLAHSFKVMFDKLQRTTTSIGVLNKEIVERKLAEKLLQKERDRAMAYLDIAGVIIVSLNRDQSIAIINKKGCEILGYDESEVIGKNWIDNFLPEKDKENTRAVFLKMMAGDVEPVKYYENYILTKENKERLIAWNNSVLRDDKGEIIATLTSGEDITDSRQAEAKRKRLEAQLQQSQKMESIGTLAGGIAHDFNNILFPILGYAEMLLEDVPEDSPFKESLKGIYTSALRAKDLVKQILTFSRQDTNELKLMKIQPIAKEALKLIRSTIPTTIEIKQDINPDCGAIKTDPTQIHQIVMNLATNAYHAMEDTGGELKVSLKEMEFGTLDLINPNMKPGVYACLIVSDTGKGMDKNVIDKIFDPFFTTKAIGKGTGMGLSVVHGIVTAMGGVIHVYSEPGKGTQFHVYLPVEKSLFEEQATTSKAQIQGGTEQILLVDDEEAILTMEKRMLTRLGYQVTSRTSSLEALEAFHDSPNKFDLVITDMAMPNMPGNKLSVELSKIRPDIPILLCTGFSETISEEKALSLGIKGFLLKPIVMKDLSHKIREVLDGNKKV